MKHHRRFTKRKHSSAADASRFGEGSNMGFASSSSASHRALDRKSAQLCSQIRRALDYIVPEVLVDTKYDAIVLDVGPAPDISNLMVLLQPFGFLEEDELRKLELEISMRAGAIRTAVAHSIHRRKAPCLSFRVIPAQARPATITRPAVG
jgi:ribosome-binding factor A